MKQYERSGIRSQALAPPHIEPKLKIKATFKTLITERQKHKGVNLVQILREQFFEKASRVLAQLRGFHHSCISCPAKVKQKERKKEDREKIKRSNREVITGNGSENHPKKENSANGEHSLEYAS